MVNITPNSRRSETWQNAKSLESFQFSQKDADRFWAKVQRSAGCWLWQGSQLGRDGYGQFVAQAGPGKAGQKHLYAHRVAWILARGPLPAGAFVCHHCDNPTCVNPDHLFVGTHTDNMQDASAKGRLSVPRKRTRHIKPLVIERYLAGDATQLALAQEYGIHHLTVCRWLKAHKEPYARPLRRSA